VNTPWDGELDFDTYQWTIPGTRTKNKKTHIVHLSEPVLKIIDALPDTPKFLFSPDKNLPHDSFSVIKPHLHQMMTSLLGRELKHWVYHDLRRTCTTGMAMLGVLPHVADRAINHVTGTKVSRTYNVHEYLDERRDALNRWGEYVQKLVTAKVKRVVLDPSPTSNRRRRRPISHQ
jgi:integrase